MKNNQKQLFRGKRAIAGVCSGIAQYLNVDALVIRIAFVIVACFSVGLAVIPYVALWVVLPSAEDEARYRPVDVNPVSVHSDKYERVVNNKTNESPVRPMGFGDFASSGHVPPQPPQGAKAAPWEQGAPYQEASRQSAYQAPPIQQSTYPTSGTQHQSAYHSSVAHQHPAYQTPITQHVQSDTRPSEDQPRNPRAQAEPTQSNDNATVAQPKAKTASFTHAPVVDSEKTNASLNGLAIALALGLLLIFALFTNLAAKQLHGVSQMQFFPVLFVVVGVIVLVVPSEKRGILQRVAGFALCTELCLALLPFTLGLVGFAALNRLGNLSIVLFFLGTIFLIAAVVFSKERLFLISACFFFVGIFVAFVDMGVFERLIAWLFSPAMGKIVSPVHLLV